MHQNSLHELLVGSRDLERASFGSGDDHVGVAFQNNVELAALVPLMEEELVLVDRFEADGLQNAEILLRGEHALDRVDSNREDDLELGC